MKRMQVNNGRMKDCDRRRTEGGRDGVTISGGEQEVKRECGEGHRATRETDICRHFNKCIKIGSSTCRSPG